MAHRVKAFAIFVAAGLTWEQTVPLAPRIKPNSSGSWKLNVQRSGPILSRGLTGLTIEIDHHEASTVRVLNKQISGKTDGTAIFGDDPPSIADGAEHVTRR